MTDAPRIPATLKHLAVPIDQLKHYGKNPRRGDVDLIKESLKTNGQYKPVTVRTGTNEILAGNHTVKAAKALGWTHIAATFMDVTDAQAAKIVLVDNRANDLATYDQDNLRDMLDSLPDLEGTGYTPDDLEAMIPPQDIAEARIGADDIPDTTPPISKPGDVWVLGRHRLVCGDATDPHAWHQALQGKPADLMWTDPPYGVDYVGGSHALSPKERLAAGGQTIKNDGTIGLTQLLTPAFQLAAAHLKPGAATYIAHADANRVVFETTARAAGFLIRQNLIWVKNTIALGHNDYHYRHEPILEAEAPPKPTKQAKPPAPAEDLTHEPILYGFNKGGSGRLGRGGKRWYGTDNRTTVFEIPKPAASREHPTMKPVALILAMLANSARPGHLIADPFGGSGSTLIAAETHGAKAALIEIDPHYCDVICARYQRHTGKPVKTPDGQTVDFTRGTTS